MPQLNLVIPKLQHQPQPAATSASINQYQPQPTSANINQYQPQPALASISQHRLQPASNIEHQHCHKPQHQPASNIEHQLQLTSTFTKTRKKSQVKTWQTKVMAIRLKVYAIHPEIQNP